MNDEAAKIVVTVTTAVPPEWFVEYQLGNRMHRATATIGQPITLPPGAKVFRHGVVILPASTLSVGVAGEATQEQAQ